MIMRKILSVISLVLVVRLYACLHLGTTDKMINTRKHAQNDQKQLHSVFLGQLGMDSITSLFLKEKLHSKSFQRSLFSKQVSQRKLNQDLRGRRIRRSLSITHSFDVLRSRLLNYIKMGYGTHGDSTDQRREKELEDRRGLTYIG